MAGKQVKKYLIDEVWDRIDKLNHERVYCNRFLLPAMQTDRLEIKMEFTKPETINGAIYNMHCGASALTIRDKGYPTVPSDWKADVSDMTGANFAKKAW
jgi:hypothetical protein